MTIQQPVFNRFIPIPWDWPTLPTDSKLYIKYNRKLESASGLEALSSNTTGNANTASGSNALALNISGSGNIANGDEALYQNSAGNCANVALRQ